MLTDRRTDMTKLIVAYRNFMKIRPVGVQFHAGGQTDGHNEADSRLSKFCERA
jgi:hypothetical protein